jgi:hypothetical protein
MTCPTCEDKLWIIGVPYSTDPATETEDLSYRDWIIPCPDCAYNLTPSQAAKLAAQEAPVGWAILNLVTGFGQAEPAEDRLRSKPWPFAIRGDSSDHISYWMDHEPDWQDALRMDAYDLADEDLDRDRKLTPTGDT